MFGLFCDFVIIVMWMGIWKIEFVYVFVVNRKCKYLNGWLCIVYIGMIELGVYCVVNSVV